MTTISIKIIKISDSSISSVYVFGNPPNKIKGKVEIYKSDGSIKIHYIEKYRYFRTLLPYVKKLLIENHILNQYPKILYYNS